MSVKVRIRMWTSGELDGAGLEHRAEGAEALLDALEHVQGVRKDMILSGTNAWTIPYATQLELLAAFVTDALHSFGRKLIERDYEADPRTKGLLPPVTAKQVTVCFDAAVDWNALAAEARANPEIEHPITHPAVWVKWIEAEGEDCPLSHLQAMAAASEDLKYRIDALLADVLNGKLDRRQTSQLHVVEGLIARAGVMYDEGISLWGLDRKVAPERHEDVEGYLKKAVGLYFLAGQLLCMPALIKWYQDHQKGDYEGTTPEDDAIPSPYEARFWMFTDPDLVPRAQRDPDHVASIVAIWKYSGTKRKYMQSLQREIDRLYRLKKIRYTGSFLICCPWNRVAVALENITVGGVHIRAGQVFALNITAEDIHTRGKFECEVVLGPFNQTDDDLDDCNPDKPDDD